MEDNILWAVFDLDSICQAAGSHLQNKLRNIEAKLPFSVLSLLHE